MAELVGGALLGNALGILSDAIIGTETKNADFKSLQNEVQGKLQTLKTLVEKIRKLDNNVRSKEIEKFVESRMEKGEKLVCLCSKVPSWNRCRRALYASKLKSMDDILESLIQFCHSANITLQNSTLILNLQATLQNGQNTTSIVYNRTSSCNHTAATVTLVQNQMTDASEDNQIQVEFVGRADLEVQLESLFKAVKEMKDRAVELNPILRSVKDTLESLESRMRQITTQFDMMPETETTGFMLDLKKGAVVVSKCASKVHHRCNLCIRQPNYTDELLSLDKTLKKLLEKLEDGQLDMHPVSMGNETQLPEFTVGLDEPLEGLKMQLLHEHGASVLIVTADGGCGKTLLAQKFCQDDHVKAKFKSNIFFFCVSKTPPSLIHIVQKLYTHKGYRVPPIQNEADALYHLKQLLNRLGQSPVLMVLDDIWPGSESLVEKFILKIPGYKILMTSRFELPEVAPLYRLMPLNDEDAMLLFSHWVKEGSPDIPVDVVRRMVDSYKAIPLALIIVATSLRMQPLEIWLKRLKESSDDPSSSQVGSNGELLASLLRNLNYSKILVKECLMDLGSFPEDQRIPAAALIDMWTELYGIKEDLTAIAYLFELTAHNLANLILTRKDVKEVDDYYGQHFVTQHDLLREIAIDNSSQESITHRKRLVMNLSGDELPEWWKRRKEQPLSASLVSISTDEKFSSKWFDMQLPAAEVLVLNFQTKEYALPNFVENMVKLKALIVTNYSLLPANLSNFQLLGSLTNLKRIRLECISIPSLSDIAEPLKNLQKISLYMCSIGQAFSNCSVQISDLLPNLREMNLDFCKDLVKLADGFCDTIHLRKLSITHCHKLSELPNEIGKLVNLKVLRLRSCIELKELPDSIRNLSKLTTLDVSDCISIKDLPEHIGDLYRLNYVNLNQCSRLQNLPESFWNLEQSIDLVCDKEQKEAWETLELCPHNITMRSVKEDANLKWLPAFS